MARHHITTATALAATGLALTTVFATTAGARPIGPFDVGGAIEVKYDQAGGYNTFGNPITPELDATGGRFQAFERNNSIYWSLGTAAHQIGGAIRDKWGAAGWENSPLGFPITDEAAAKNNGRYNRFNGGDIYWSPTTGAHIIWGSIRDTWLAAGGENGRYGYPTGDEFDYEGGKAQDFQGGRITWEP
ncbi:LGFP repeat-containing protein [Nocardia cyriacigeorgica]|uniref:LGFP repeat-containing protein n=1 Tax=Nocardia cyriacigeorgica TaxID=135487 RepID=UPI002453F91B|nr:hypothetical protein [Nocardia cyriacigeorgica]